MKITLRVWVISNNRRIMYVYRNLDDAMAMELGINLRNVIRVLWSLEFI